MSRVMLSPGRKCSKQAPPPAPPPGDAPGVWANTASTCAGPDNGSVLGRLEPAQKKSSFDVLFCRFCDCCSSKWQKCVKTGSFSTNLAAFLLESQWDVSPWKPPSLISLTGLLGSGSVAVALLSVVFRNQGLWDADRVLLPPGAACWCSNCTGVMALERGALWGSGGLWGALWGMGTVMPCRELLVGLSWLSDITVEGMRQGDRLDVLVRRRAFCWAGLPDAAASDSAAPLLPSGSGLADALTGLLACWGEDPCDEPPAAPPTRARERKSWGEPWVVPVSLWGEGSTRCCCCCWERPESPFSRGGTSWTDSLWKVQRTLQKLEAWSRKVDGTTVLRTGLWPAPAEQNRAWCAGGPRRSRRPPRSEAPCDAADSRLALAVWWAENKTAAMTTAFGTGALAPGKGHGSIRMGRRPLFRSHHWHRLDLNANYWAAIFVRVKANFGTSDVPPRVWPQSPWSDSWWAAWSHSTVGPPGSNNAAFPRSARTCNPWQPARPAPLGDGSSARQTEEWKQGICFTLRSGHDDLWCTLWGEERGLGDITSCLLHHGNSTATKASWQPQRKPWPRTFKALRCLFFFAKSAEAAWFLIVLQTACFLTQTPNHTCPDPGEWVHLGGARRCVTLHLHATSLACISRSPYLLGWRLPWLFRRSFFSCDWQRSMDSDFDLRSLWYFFKVAWEQKKKRGYF